MIVPSGAVDLLPPLPFILCLERNFALLNQCLQARSCYIIERFADIGSAAVNVEDHPWQSMKSFTDLTVTAKRFIHPARL